MIYLSTTTLCRQYPTKLLAIFLVRYFHKKKTKQKTSEPWFLKTLKIYYHAKTQVENKRLFLLRFKTAISHISSTPKTTQLDLTNCHSNTSSLIPSWLSSKMNYTTKYASFHHSNYQHSIISNLLITNLILFSSHYIAFPLSCVKHFLAETRLKQMSLITIRRLIKNNDRLIDYNIMSIGIGLLYAKRLRNCFHFTFYFCIFLLLFLKKFVIIKSILI